MVKSSTLQQKKQWIDYLNKLMHKVKNSNRIFKINWIPPADLSEHSTESLEEELKLLELDKKDIQAELRKRKKTDNSNGQVDKA